MSRTIITVGILSICTAVISGCGDGTEGGRRVDLVPVSGKVTMGGAAIDGATVSFSPKAPGTPAAIGRTNDVGEFELTTYDAGDGAAPGLYIVIIMKSVAKKSTADPEHSAEGVPSEKSHEASESPSGSDSGIPDIYTDASSTPLKSEVRAGEENKFEYTLE